MSSPQGSGLGELSATITRCPAPALQQSQPGQPSPSQSRDKRVCPAPGRAGVGRTGGGRAAAGGAAGREDRRAPPSAPELAGEGDPVLLSLPFSHSFLRSWFCFVLLMTGELVHVGTTLQHHRHCQAPQQPLGRGPAWVPLFLLPVGQCWPAPCSGRSRLVPVTRGQGPVGPYSGEAREGGKWVWPREVG